MRARAPRCSALAMAATGLAAVVSLGACHHRPGPGPAHGSSFETLRTGGHRRTYALHLPARAGNAPVPLLIVLHGFGGNGLDMEDGTHFSQLADTANAIVAYPDGLRTYGFAGPRHWSSSGSDETDVEFIRALIDEIAKHHRVDSHRIYVTGFSNGASMAYRIAAELADRIAAIGAVAGAIGRRDDRGRATTIRAPSRPVPVVAMHGVLDDRVAYGDSASARRGVLPVAAAMAFWREQDHCPTPPLREISHDGNVVAERSTGCAESTDVLYYSVQDGAHTWFMLHPDSLGSISARHDFTATDLVWAFLSAHRR